MLAIATKNIVLVTIEAAFLVESFLQAAAGTVDANLGRSQRAAGDLGDLRGGLPFEIVEHKGRSVILRQAIDDLSDAAAHLIDNHPLIDEVEVVNNSSSRVAIYYILLHEIGHTIQFGHVPFKTFIMFGRHPLPADISQDEIDVLRLLLALPTRLNLANYDELYP